jgi:hypothetical protein
VFTTVYVCGGLLVVPSAMVRWPELAAVVAAWCAVATATTWLLSGQTREAPESWVLVPIAGVVFLLVAPWLPSLAALLDRE